MRTLLDLVRPRRSGADYWLAGDFDRAPRPLYDRAVAAWSELLGRDGAELWLKDHAVAARAIAAPHRTRAQAALARR